MYFIPVDLPLNYAYIDYVLCKSRMEFCRKCTYLTMEWLSRKSWVA